MRAFTWHNATFSEERQKNRAKQQESRGQQMDGGITQLDNGRTNCRKAQGEQRSKVMRDAIYKCKNKTTKGHRVEQKYTHNQQAHEGTNK
eukprot:scaffold93738_cov42-Prasinocladus_malaysianus.AAC.1